MFISLPFFPTPSTPFPTQPNTKSGIKISSVCITRDKAQFKEKYGQKIMISKAELLFTLR